MRTNWRTVVLYGAIFGVVSSAFTYLSTGGHSQLARATSTNLPAADPACGPLPTLGTTSLLDGGMLQRDDVQTGILAIRNDQPVPLVAVLADLTMARSYQAITVGARSEAQGSIPSGQYGFGIMSGRSWCNLDIGFTDGSKHSINGGVLIKPQSTTQAIVGLGASPGQISLVYRNLYRTEEQRGGGLEVRLSPTGYVTSGSVNGKPAAFVLDTGASHATLPAWLAQQAGIQCDRAVEYLTAAGSQAGCNGMAAELSFGPFTLRNVEVAIVSGGNTALLGMDVLRRFNMAWRDDAVRITSLDSPTLAPAVSHQVPFAPVVPWIAPALVQLGSAMVPTLIARDGEPWRFRQYAGFILGVLSLLSLGKWVQQRKLLRFRGTPGAPSNMYYNPKDFRKDRMAMSPDRHPPQGSPQRRLLAACLQDKELMLRLMDYEKEKSSTSITDAEAAERAIYRIERDRK